MNLRLMLRFALGIASTGAAEPPRNDYPFTDIPPVVLRDTRAEDWPDLRSRIETRLGRYQGQRPPAPAAADLEFAEVSRDEVFGLARVRYRFRVLDDTWSEADLLLPPGFNPAQPRAAVLALHGTADAGKLVVQSHDRAPHRAYAIELARRGYLVLAPDLFGYGADTAAAERGNFFRAFEEKYPAWTQSDRRVWGLQRALDLLDRLPGVRHADGYGAIGNSLGGGFSLRLMAADPRIAVAVISTGVSPQATNIYRNVGREAGARVAADDLIRSTGRPPFEVTDFIALCAPRPVLFLEPFEDPYNPDTTASFLAIRNSWLVWRLLGAPEKVSLLLHGDGHTTLPDAREHAYRWIERWLPATR